MVVNLARKLTIIIRKILPKWKKRCFGNVIAPKKELLKTTGELEKKEEEATLLVDQFVIVR